MGEHDGTSPRLRRNSLAIFRDGVLILLGLIWGVFLLQWLGWLRLPWGSSFSLIIVLMFGSSAYWWAWVDVALRDGHLCEPRRRRWLRPTWAGYVLLTLLPLVLVPLVGRMAWDGMPVPTLSWTMSWHLLIVGAGAGAVVLAIVRGLYALARRVRPAATEAAPVNLSRRRLLTQAVAAAPLALTAAGVVRGHFQADAFITRRITLKLPRLPSRLQGLTITHITDLHVGRLFRREHLPRMVEAANALGSDIVAITGDVLDHSNAYLADACDAIAQLEHRHGRFLVAGNHDLMDEPLEFIQYVSERERLLIDRHQQVTIGGETIQVAGLFWSRSEVRTPRDPGHAGRTALALAGADPELFTIGLAHHPHAFDALADRGVDLTLAGHTHGGQLMLTPPGTPYALGAGNLMFRYIWGEYRRGQSAMFVSSGVGNWFPVRVNAPAEIVQIRLV